MGLISKCFILALIVVFISVEAGLAAPLSDDLIAIDQFAAYKFYIKRGIAALERHELKRADCYFQLALIYAYSSADRDKAKALRVRIALDLLEQSASPPSTVALPKELPDLRESQLEEFLRREEAREKIIEHEIKAWESVYGKQRQAGLVQAMESFPEISPAVDAREGIAQHEQGGSTRRPELTAKVRQFKESDPLSWMPVLAPKETSIFVGQKAPDQPVASMSLYDATSSAQAKRAMRIELGTTIILEGRNIRNFLMVDEGFISADIINHNQIKIKAVKRGSTFIHVWDDTGRWTVYFEVVFPKDETAKAAQETLIDHSKPFRFNYSMDWSNYYYGSKLSDIKRQNRDIQQSSLLTGDTPYGAMDAGLSYSRVNGLANLDTYTLGLSEIPLEGSSHFNLRIFDALRFMSVLTMPGTRLRGGFADINLFQDMVGLKVSSGRKLSTLGFFSLGSSVDRKTYVDAVKLTFFPENPDHQYSFNYARGYGSQHEDYLTKRVYSVTARHRFNEVLLTGELAQDGDQDNAALAGVAWEPAHGKLHSGLHFRDTNKAYTTIISNPASQGEIGATWDTLAEFENFSAQTTLDVYRDRLFFNPDDSDALNLDASAHFRMFLNPSTESETSFYYVDTPGEISPRRNVGIDQRFSRYFDIWEKRKLNVFTGGTYQRSRYKFSAASEYDRYSALVGLRLPLTNRLSSYVNYEYSWVHETDSKNDFRPHVLNTGFNYSWQLSKRLSMNSQVNYRKERGASGTNTFLAGEDSVGASVGFNYQPANDVNIFVDGRTRKVWAQTDQGPSYTDFDVHVGMRLVFDVFPGWDPTGIVAGYVYKDRNRNKILDQGDEGVAGVKVKVGNQVGETDAHGYFRVKIKAKAAVVLPDADTLPNGFMFSTLDQMKVDIIQNRTSRADFGLIGQTSIYGLVFVDTNGNGTPESDETFVRKVRLQLDNAVTQITDGQGAYYFRDLNPGAHTIAVDMNSLPMEMIPNVSLMSDLKVVEGSTYVYHVPLRLKEQP